MTWVRNVCHYFQEELYAYSLTTRKIPHVPCLRILLPGLWYLHTKAGYAYRDPVAVVAIFEGNSMRLHIAASWNLFLPRKEKKKLCLLFCGAHPYIITRAEIMLYRTQSHDCRTVSI